MVMDIRHPEKRPFPADGQSRVPSAQSRALAVLTRPALRVSVRAGPASGLGYHPTPAALSVSARPEDAPEAGCCQEVCFFLLFFVLTVRMKQNDYTFRNPFLIKF